MSPEMLAGKKSIAVTVTAPAHCHAVAVFPTKVEVLYVAAAVCFS